mmetsp:Transcript_508/g.965  ORF Transcript_508/g.965 Transcript_508/m.965 type:complete len:377 (-) Transcript_508:944-2074(-)
MFAFSVGSLLSWSTGDKRWLTRRIANVCEGGVRRVSCRVRRDGKRLFGIVAMEGDEKALWEKEEEDDGEEEEEGDGGEGEEMDDDDYFFVDGKHFGELLDRMILEGKDGELLDPGNSEEQESTSAAASSLSYQALVQRLEAQGSAGSDHFEMESGAGVRKTLAGQVEPWEAVGSNGTQVDVAHRLEREDYFEEAYAEFMPPWARAIYHTGNFADFVEGAERLAVNRGTRTVQKGSTAAECSVSDLAEDFNIPVEYLIQVVVNFGVSPPIDASAKMKDLLNADQIEQIIAELTTFDFYSLNDSYSDRPVRELCQLYDLTESQIQKLCKDLQVFLPIGLDSRLILDDEKKLVSVLEGDPFPGEPDTDDPSPEPYDHDR